MSDEFSGKLIADKYRVGELIREDGSGQTITREAVDRGSPQSGVARMNRARGITN